MSDQATGDALKAQGNVAYKARDFDKAIELYNQAWEANKDITYLNNLSGESRGRARDKEGEGRWGSSGCWRKLGR